MTNITYVDRTFGSKEEVEKYLQQIRKINEQNYKNKKEFNKIYKLMKNM